VASPSSAAKVLITGIDGFTGKILAELLQAAGYDVHGTVQSTRCVSAFPMHVVDLLDREGLRRVAADVRPDLVAHLAAIAFVAHGDVDAIYRVNVVGTRNLLDAISQAGYMPKSILLASSANIYGNSELGVLHESVPPAPANDYAVSKLAMEYAAKLWMDRLPITIVRPFNYTGVGQADNFLLPKIVSHFQRADKAIELGNIDVERDFSDVRYVASVYKQLLELGPAGQTFNVCSGKAVSLKQAIAMVGKLAGYDIDIRVNPAFVRANEVQRLLGDTSKLYAAIGSQTPIALESTLQWMYESRQA
jgi:GDP-6-deoxy-D-talose 4-dehydrogenase